MDSSVDTIKGEDSGLQKTVKAKRPFFLAMICVAILAYTSVLSLAFLVALIYNGWIARTLNDYFEGSHVAPGSFFWLALSGLILNLLSFFAATRLWQLKKDGLLFICRMLFIFCAFPICFGLRELL